MAKDKDNTLACELAESAKSVMEAAIITFNQTAAASQSARNSAMQAQATAAQAVVESESAYVLAQAGLAQVERSHQELVQWIADNCGDPTYP